MPIKHYYLVLFEEGKSKGCANAMPSIVDEKTTSVLLQDDNATIYRKNGTFTITGKRLFEVVNVDGSKTLYIVCDVKRIGQKNI